MAATDFLDGAFRPAREKPKPYRAPDFRELLGADWHHLPPAVQRRFAHAETDTLTYTGTFTAVRASRWGRALAWACRLIGTPLSLWTGRDLGAVVSIYPHPKGGAMWQRRYDFPGHAPLTVTSIKRAGPNRTVDEYVGLGFGMCLKVTVEQGVLHFRSLYHFWQCGPLRVKLPWLITPGRVHVFHKDHGKGTFCFRFTSVHPYLGRIYFQNGLFQDEDMKEAL